MTKTKAKELFKGTKGLREALGITRQAVSYWPDELPQRLTDEVIGAAIRTGNMSMSEIFDYAHNWSTE